MTKHSKTEPVARESASIPEDQLSCLRACFPEAFTEDKVDMEKLRDTLGDIVETSPERYSFTWAGKKEAIRILQTPSRATLVPSPKESVTFNETSNMFIEGDNLEALKLLYKSYFGRVKMIYIDPPYNTGHDFIYPDNYADPLDNYLKLSGQKDANGNLLTSNPDTNGRYHSAWLSMMYPRLFLARQFLREDGVIFVSIDDNEVHNLKMVMNEIFGEENFITTVIWQKNFAPRSVAKHFSEDHEFVLVYARNIEKVKIGLLPRSEETTARYQNPDNDPRGEWGSDNLLVSLTSGARGRQYQRTGKSDNLYEVKSPSGNKFSPPAGSCWRYSQTKFNELDADNRIWWGNDGKNMPRLKRFLSEIREGVIPQTCWLFQEVGHTQEASKELKALFEEYANAAFPTPKPVRLIQRMLQLSTGHDPEEEDIVLDFFAGSSSTAHAVLAQNKEDGVRRRFIMIQLPERLEFPLDKNLQTISDIGKERIRRAQKNIKTKEGFKVFKLTQSNYRPWTGTEERDPAVLAKQMEVFNDPLTEGWKPENVLYEVAIKEGFGLNIQTEHIENVKGQEVHRVTDPDREQSFYLCLDDKLNIDALAPLKLTQDDLFICRDIALDDTAAANLALQCRLKTI